MATEPGGQPSDSRREILDRIAREAPPPRVEAEPLPSSDASRTRAAAHSNREAVGYASASDPLITLVCAGLFLWVGFSISFLRPGSEPLVAFVATVFPSLARVVGFGLLLLAGLEFAGIAFARPLNLVIALIAAISCIGAGLIWIFHQYSEGWLYILFGLLNGSAARSAYFAWKGR
jgi:hypothetical protein